MGPGCVTLAVMIQLLASGVCSDFCVNYPHPHVCAVRGSSVVIPCSFCYPGMFSRRRARRVMWGHERSNIFKGPFVFDSKFMETSSKFQYIGDKHQNCSLRINRVDHSDKGRYTFRFILHAKRKKFTGTSGSRLNVKDLHVWVSKPVGKGQIKEGESVSLTCINSCDGGSSAISWFKDRVHIKVGPVLHLDNLSTRSSGSYACSLNNEPGTLSPPVHVSVGYCPKDTSVSVRPSTEVNVDINITLTCSSDANPPVENYTWFVLRGSEREAVGHKAQLLLTPASVPADGGEYLCSVTNKHGCQNSSPVKLNKKGGLCLRDAGSEATRSRRVRIIAAVVVFLMAVTGIAVISLFNKSKEPSIYDSEENIQLSNSHIYANWPISDESQDGKEPERPPEASYTRVYVRRKPNMEEQMNLNYGVDDAIYSDVCRDQISNPSCVQQY